jgi:cerevisin
MVTELTEDSPHVAGLLAYMLSLQPGMDSAYAVGDEPISAARLKKDIITFGTKGVLSGVAKNTANVLLFNGGGSGNYSEIVRNM